MRTLDELSIRAVYVLAVSFRNIRPLRWERAEGGKASLTVEAMPNDELVVLGYRGSALVRLDGRPYFALDGYHKAIPLPQGKHVVEAEFSPYAAFGELVGFSPGDPYLVNRDYSALRFWAYAVSAIELARATNNDEVREALIRVLTDAFRLVPFTTISRLQLKLAAGVYGMPWSERLEQTITEDLGKVFTEGGGADFERALNVLRGGLRELVSRYGKPGLLVGFGHAHIDTAWLWNFDETRRKVLRTFSTVVTLMRRFNFTYMQSSALYYMWVLEDDPKLFEEIARLVKEGRWVLGAGIVEADANMISGESWARQLLYSQRFYKERFGKYAEILWLPDTFGFTQSIPQIARQAKIKAFATHKVYWNDTNKFPYSIFNWVSQDGTGILAVTFGDGRGGYNSDFTTQSVLEQWRNWKAKDQPMLYSYGYGDGGGGPTVEMLLRAEAINELPTLPKVDLTMGERYFDSVKPTGEWRGWLYLETHRGTLTSHSRMKYLNRRVELWLRELELWCTIAGCYNNASMRDLWITLLKDQFHDVLPGSAIREVYETVYGELGELLSKVQSMTMDAISRIAGTGSDLVVFNSMPWMRIDYVKLDTGLPGTQPFEGGYLALVRAPSIGYAPVKPIEPTMPVKLTETSSGFTLENSRLRVTLSKDGSVAEVYDKLAGRQVLSSPGNVIVAYENMPGWADAWDIEKGFEETSFRLTASDAKVIYTGPLVAGVRFTYSFRRSEIIQDVLLYADKPRLDFKTTIRLVDRELMYKAWFNLDVNAEYATGDAPYTPVNWPTVTNTPWDLARFEVPIHKYIDLSEAGYGVALLNDGKYGVTIRGSSIGLTLARTPIFPDPTTDLDEITFTYSLYPHQGGFADSLVYREAFELNMPMLVARGRANDVSFISVDRPNIMVEAVKKAEDDDSVIIRLSEQTNARTSVEVALWRNVAEAVETNILEDEAYSRLEVLGNRVRVPVRPRQFKTIRVRYSA